MLPNRRLRSCVAKQVRASQHGALALAGAVSRGKSFAGLETQFAPVVYLDRENPQPIAQQRLRDQKIRTGVDFYYWGSWIEPEAVPLSDAIIREYVGVRD
jgi:hypothetical protein